MFPLGCYSLSFFWDLLAWQILLSGTIPCFFRWKVATLNRGCHQPPFPQKTVSPTALFAPTPHRHPSPPIHVPPNHFLSFCPSSCQASASIFASLLYSHNTGDANYREQLKGSIRAESTKLPQRGFGNWAPQADHRGGKSAYRHMRQQTKIKKYIPVTPFDNLSLLHRFPPVFKSDAAKWIGNSKLPTLQVCVLVLPGIRWNAPTPRTK